jgi:tetratricopeptide (TPR) repeat protein
VWVERAQKRHAAERRAAERAVRAAPGNPEAWLTLASATDGMAGEVRQGRFTSALSPAEQQFLEVLYDQWVRITLRATKLAPRYGKAWYRLAQAATFQSDEPLSRAAYWKAGKLPMSAEEREGWLGWGLQMFQPKWNDEPGDLRRVAELAISNQYSTPAKASELVESLQDAGLAQESRTLQQHELEALEALVKAHPEDPLPHWELSCVLSDAGENRRAYEEDLQLVRLRPNDGGAHYELAVCLERLQRHAESNKEYGIAARLQPDHAMARFNYGWSLKEERKFAEAEVEFKAAVHAAPDYGDAYYGLGQLYQAQHRNAEALAAYRQGAAQDPWNQQLRMALPQQLVNEKRWDEAEAACERLLHYHTNDVWLLNELGYARAMKRDFPGSLRAFEAVLALEPENATALENHAESLCELGRKEEGRAELERVLGMGQARAAAEARKSMAKYFP